MKTKDWTLVLAWLAYLAFVGPALVSAKDWVWVAVGFTIPLVLSYITYKRISPKK